MITQLAENWGNSKAHSFLRGFVPANFSEIPDCPAARCCHKAHFSGSRITPKLKNEYQLNHFQP